MGKKDDVTKDYMSDNERFADVFNYLIYDGKQVIKKDDLTEKDPTELTILNNGNDIFSKQKMRDVLKQCIVKKSGDITYVLMGIENQSDIHYAMVIKNLLYDTLNYASQADMISAVHKKNKDLRKDEFLSHFAKTDRIYPVITLTLYWGTEKWDAPVRLSDMFPPGIPEEIIAYTNDYTINLITPDRISNYRKFSTEIGDVLEFIARSKEVNVMEEMIKERNGKWKLNRKSVNVINIMTGAGIKSQDEEDEEIDMCVATQTLIDKGISQGISKGENRLVALLRKIQSNPEELNRAINADDNERQEMYRQYGID